MVYTIIQMNRVSGITILVFYNDQELRSLDQIVWGHSGETTL